MDIMKYNGVSCSLFFWLRELSIEISSYPPPEMEMEMESKWNYISSLILFTKRMCFNPSCSENGICCGHGRCSFKIESFSFKKNDDHVKNKGFIPTLTPAENTTLLKVTKVVLEKYLNPNITDKYLNECTRPEIINMLLEVAVNLGYISKTGIQFNGDSDSDSGGDLGGSAPVPAPAPASFSCRCYSC